MTQPEKAVKTLQAAVARQKAAREAAQKVADEIAAERARAAQTEVQNGR